MFKNGYGILICVAFPLLLVVFFNQGCGQFSSVSTVHLNSEAGGVALASKAKIRLLNAREYKNTIESLTGYSVTAEFSHEDKSAGYSTGDRLKLEASLFASFYNEAKNAAEAYVVGKGLVDFPCLSSPDEACFRSSLLAFSEKAFRRPLGASDIEDLNSLSSTLNSIVTLTPIEKFQLSISRTLVSPNFLYRQEIGKSTSEAGLTELDAFEKASFLSYTLTGDAPDSELYSAAKNGELGLDDIKPQVRRLMNSEKGQDHLVGFFKDWLHLDNLDLMAKNPDQFAKFSSLETGPSLEQEFSKFVKDVVFAKGGNLVDLMTNTTTFANQHTAPFYGASVEGDVMQPVDMGSNRSGILTLASVMASHASSTTAEVDNPSQRGILLKERLLCEKVGLPSGLDTVMAQERILEDFPEFDTFPVRKQSEITMNQSQSCTQCHAQFMPLGYVFSNFDALGQFQVTQKGLPINSSVTVNIGGNSADFEGVADFLPDLAAEPTFHKCFSQQVASFVSGSAEEGGAGNLRAQFYRHLQAGDLRIDALLVNTLSDPKIFQRRREP